MTPMDQPPPRWVIKATMAQALTVDEPDYGAAMARVTGIWRNWDREGRQCPRPRGSAASGDPRAGSHRELHLRRG